MDNSTRPIARGLFAWMANNHVAANLLLFTFIVSGLLTFPSLKRELMPNIEAENIQVSVRYPGSTPDEIEEGIIIAIEESLSGINGIKNITSTSNEGSGSVRLELMDGADVMRTRNEIERQIQQISTFPNDMEKPVVREMTRRSMVLSILVSGHVGQHALRELAEQVRDDLLLQDGISIVELSNVASPEISVEISQEALQAFGLKISDVASVIQSSSIDLSAGNLKVESGAVLLRTQQRKRFASEFEGIVLRSMPDGRTVRLSDVAKLTDGFEDTDFTSSFNGRPAIQLNVLSTGNETPVGVSDAVRAYLREREGTFPAGIYVDIRSDRADSYRVRIDLLMNNAWMGLILVLVFIGLLLDIRVAFWTATGLVMSFVGAIAVMVLLDVSFNMISLFGFILALGIVVDDTIVVGEAVYVRQQKGSRGVQSALEGLKEVSTPVILSVLTTIIAFIPLLFLPGTIGKQYRDLAIIVIIILALSIVESMFILPAHLADLKPEPDGFLRWIRRGQLKIARGFEWLIEKCVRRVFIFCLNWRYVVASVTVAILVGTVGYVASGKLRYTMMPDVEGDTVRASIRMADGSPVSRIREVEAYVLKKTQEVIEDFGRESITGVFSQISSGSSGTIEVYLTPATQRTYASSQFSSAWREKVGEVAGVENLTFRFDERRGPGGAGAQFNISHRDSDILEVAAEEFAARLRLYHGVKDVDVNTAAGKAQLTYKLRPEARSLGITETDFARQLRAAVFGAEAMRQQRGRNEVKVFVRYPELARKSEALVEDFLLRTPSGGLIPLSEAATVERGFAYRTIRRENGKRIVSVSAELEGGVTTVELVAADMRRKDMPELQTSYPGLSMSLGGMHADSGEMWSKMTLYFGFSIFIMFAIIAITSRSYLQSIMILVAIPFGFVGAILGHIMLGYNLSLISILGMVALSGVVINASVVLTSVINDNIAAGMSLYDAVVEGSTRRFRPIFLSVMTTFLGVFPMILETSKEARFLIPMAISLGVGVLFSFVITLIIVPCNYLIVDDIRVRIRRLLD